MSEALNTLEIIYRDEHLIAVNKPVNLPVHKNDFMPHDADYLTKQVGEICGCWVHNVHRLDSKTSGIILLALNQEVAKHLHLQFEQRKVKKTYMALTKGSPDEGVFENKVLIKKRGQKKKAETHYRCLKTYTTGIEHKDTDNLQISLVELKPVTGRWHQLRQHLAQQRFDIIGDTHHGDWDLNRMITAKTELKRLMLHASEIEFEHPVSGEQLHLKCDLPEEFTKLQEYLESIVS